MAGTRLGHRTFKEMAFFCLNKLQELKPYPGFFYRFREDEKFGQFER